MIAFPCPKCRFTLKAPEEKAGDRSKCPKCGSPIEIPKLGVLIAPTMPPAIGAPAAASVPAPAVTPAVQAPATRPAARNKRIVVVIAGCLAAVLLICSGAGVVGVMLSWFGGHGRRSPDDAEGTIVTTDVPRKPIEGTIIGMYTDVNRLLSMYCLIIEVNDEEYEINASRDEYMKARLGERWRR